MENEKIGESQKKMPEKKSFLRRQQQQQKIDSLSVVVSIFCFLFLGFWVFLNDLIRGCPCGETTVVFVCLLFCLLLLFFR